MGRPRTQHQSGTAVAEKTRTEYPKQYKVILLNDDYTTMEFIATTKVEQVTSYARKHQHPLQCVMEET